MRISDWSSDVCSSDLYPSQARPTRRGRRAQEAGSDVEAMVRDLSELREGDPVVHAQHGIGRYCGLREMDLGEGMMEFLHLESRSEEHTSELQSLMRISYAVFCLKKKNKKYEHIIIVNYKYKH